MEPNKKLIDLTLDGMHFGIILKLCSQFNGFVEMFEHLHVSATYAERRMTVDSLREDAESLLKSLYDDSKFPDQSLIERNIAHGFFSVEVADTKDGEITALSLYFTPMISEGWVCDLK